VPQHSARVPRVSTASNCTVPTGISSIIPPGRQQQAHGQLRRLVRESCEAASGCDAAVISVWGSDRVAVRLSPSSTFGEMADSDPQGLFRYVAQQLDTLKLAYLHLIEPRWLAEEGSEEQTPVVTQELRKHFSGVVITAGGFDGQSAKAIVEAGYADMIAFGRHFVANPDLPKRLRRNLPLNRYDRSTFYGGSEVGYTDYPFYEDETEGCEA